MEQAGLDPPPQIGVEFEISGVLGCEIVEYWKGLGGEGLKTCDTLVRRGFPVPASFSTILAHAADTQHKRSVRVLVWETRSSLGGAGGGS